MGIWRPLSLLVAGNAVQARAATCPGAFNVEGYGTAKLVNAKWNVPQQYAVDVDFSHHQQMVMPRLGGRTYFADSCAEGAYTNNQYMALELLGQTIKYTVDLSSAGCGCNVAFYLTSMRQNTEASDCSDYYCDANSVCGVACSEIDIMEANTFAWHSTLHAHDDKNGVGKGYGGGDDWIGARDWKGTDYGPGGRCIDTRKPFQVSASFPVDKMGQLTAMEVTLTQEGHNCPLSVSVAEYKGMAELSRALEAGMTPIISYWSSDDMIWMDGQGSDHKGPCAKDDARVCQRATPKLYGFSVEGAGITGQSRGSQAAVAAPKACPGAATVAGLGEVSMVNARWNKPGDAATKVDVLDGSVVAHMRGRTYFGSRCSQGDYSNQEYVALPLLGKRFRYTVDLSAAGCGCNAALYLTSLRQNWQKSECSDYYCDANKVCGVNCAEIDIQEANSRSFYTTLHVSDDGGGVGKGYGAGRSDWNGSVYGPGARCIDTSEPFQVASSFPVDSRGELRAVEVTLTQPGKPCPLSLSINAYNPFGRNGMGELSQALREGMTPIISYWGAGEDMAWMDGRGSSGLGPCDSDDPASCGDFVRFYNFAVESLPQVVHTTLERTRTTTSTTSPTSTSMAPTSTLLAVSPSANSRPLSPGERDVPPLPAAGAGAAPRSRYTFAGFARPEAARYGCGRQRRLVMPKTPEQQLAVQQAIAEEIRRGRMSTFWPNNTVWIGAHWNAMESHWEWDDGMPIEPTSTLNWAKGQPSSTEDQLKEPWLCMVQDGYVHDSDPPYSFGVLCEPLPDAALGAAASGGQSPRPATAPPAPATPAAPAPRPASVLSPAPAPVPTPALVPTPAPTAPPMMHAVAPTVVPRAPAAAQKAPTPAPGPSLPDRIAAEIEAISREQHTPAAHPSMPTPRQPTLAPVPVLPDTSAGGPQASVPVEQMDKGENVITISIHTPLPQLDDHQLIMKKDSLRKSGAARLASTLAPAFLVPSLPAAAAFVAGVAATVLWLRARPLGPAAPLCRSLAVGGGSVSRPHRTAVSYSQLHTEKPDADPDSP